MLPIFVNMEIHSYIISIVGGGRRGGVLSEG